MGQRPWLFVSPFLPKFCCFNKWHQWEYKPTLIQLLAGHTHLMLSPLVRIVRVIPSWLCCKIQVCFMEIVKAGKPHFYYSITVWRNISSKLSLMSSLDGLFREVFLCYIIDPFPFHPSELWRVSSCLQRINRAPIKCILELYHANTQAHKYMLPKVQLDYTYIFYSTYFTVYNQALKVVVVVYMCVYI